MSAPIREIRKCRSARGLGSIFDYGRIGVTVHPTGYSAFGLMYGQDCLLPMDFTMGSWSLVDRNVVRERLDTRNASNQFSIT